MTEDEAKTKWCPMARASALEECRTGVATYSYNRAGTASLPDDCMCIASDCMVWTKTMVMMIRDDVSGFVDVEDGRCGLIK